MVNQTKQDAENRMKKTLDALQNELAKMRTGRAHPSLIEHIKVEYYGNSTPLNQVASVTVSDARTLTISPWEKNMIPVIEKAIIASDLGLNPASSGTVIRVPMPPLSEQRRKELIKVAKGYAEEGRVSVRNIRRDANNDFKEALKAKSITEDDERRGQDSIQKLTDQYISKIDALVENKEKELMEV
ncbi:MAG: ribosome recycling factor [Proteobacteria bacterium]|nr:ribosome recycling factor [Pseudomonadota bacterium]